MRPNRSSRQRKIRTTRRSKQLQFDNLETRVFLTGTPLGVNLEPVEDWSRSFMFVDAMKSARAFGSALAPWDGTAPVDKNGDPTSDFGAVIITVNSPTLSVQDFPSIAGTYHFSATGRATIGGVASALNVINQQYEPETNRTTADIVVRPEATTLYLSFTNTDGGLRDMKLIRPGYDADTPQTFTEEFKRSLEPFQTLRLMDYAATNNNQVVEWDDRAKPTDAIQTTEKGAAWEYAIELANETGKDLWINVPAHASDDYVHQLANLLHEELDSSRNVYVEYSNEVWNSGFEQFHANLAAATEAGLADPTVLNYDNSGNVYQWGWRRTVQKLMEVRDIFAEVYGEDAMNTTVRPVLASQIGWNYVIRDQLNFLERFYGEPKDSIYGIAGAPYINIGAMSLSPTLTTDQVIASLQQSIRDMRASIQRYDALAAYYGVKNLMYEGGLDMQSDVGGNFVNAKLPANYDPRIAQVMTDYLNTAYADGIDELMYFMGTGAYGVYGTWGLTENVYNLDGAKFKAVRDFANAARPETTGGHRLPSAVTGGQLTIDAGWYIADRWQMPGNGGVLSFPSVGSTYDYYLNSQGASYTLNLSAGAWAAGSEVELLLDNKLIATVTIPATGSHLNYVTLPPVNLTPEGTALSVGQHTLRLRVKSGGFALRSLTFSSVASSPALIASAVSSSQVDLYWQNGQHKGFYLERSSNGIDGWQQITSTVLPGDANLDGTVDFLDFVVLSNNYGKPGGWTQGNFTGSATVGFDSFAILSNNYGKSYEADPLGYSFYQDSQLAAGTTYYYRVRAATAGNLSSFMATASATTVPLENYFVVQTEPLVQAAPAAMEPVAPVTVAPVVETVTTATTAPAVIEKPASKGAEETVASIVEKVLPAKAKGRKDVEPVRAKGRPW